MVKNRRIITDRSDVGMPSCVVGPMPSTAIFGELFSVFIFLELLKVVTVAEVIVESLLILLSLVSLLFKSFCFIE